MATTGHTPNYDLSQYAPGDVTSYLTNYNSDMLKIDTGIAQAKVEAVQGVNDAAGALRAAQAADANATAAMNRANTAYQNAENIEALFTPKIARFTAQNLNLVGYNIASIAGGYELVNLDSSTIASPTNTIDTEHHHWIPVGTTPGNPFNLSVRTLPEVDIVTGGFGYTEGLEVDSSFNAALYYDGTNTVFMFVVPKTQATALNGKRVKINAIWNAT